MIGIFRYVRHPDVADRMNQGWRYAANLGPTHGHWSALMWWCCGACADGEAPAALSSHTRASKDGTP